MNAVGGANPNPPERNCCRFCQNWQAPSASAVSAFEAWMKTGRGRPVRRPNGTCDRVLSHLQGTECFSTTAPHFVCLNYAPRAHCRSRASDEFVVVRYNHGETEHE